MNILIENVKEIAKISFTRGADWSKAQSIWESENPGHDISPEDRSVFHRFVRGECDEEGNAITGGKMLEFKMNEDGEVVRVD